MTRKLRQIWYGFTDSSAGLFVLVCALSSLVITAGVIAVVAFQALDFFKIVPWQTFFFGLKWSPQLALTGSTDGFGAIPVFTGTLLITAVAMDVAVPFGILSAVFLSNFAAPALRIAIKPVLESLAGVPTVVFGYFAATAVAPWVRDMSLQFGLVDVSTQSALAAGVVMGIMILPLVASLSEDVLSGLPTSYSLGAAALGATRAEAVWHVLLPAAFPGLMGAVLLGISRALGETMIVVMAAGLAANLTLNPLEAVTTATVQIANLLVGDQSFDSPKTLSAYALALTLLVLTLVLNMVSLAILDRYKRSRGKVV